MVLNDHALEEEEEIFFVDIFVHFYPPNYDHFLESQKLYTGYAVVCFTVSPILLYLFDIFSSVNYTIYRFPQKITIKQGEL